MLVTVLKFLLLSFAFHFYKNRYPKEFEGYSNQLFEYVQNNESLKPILPYIVKVGYAFIYIYSCCQIFLNKVIRVSNPYVMSVRDKVHDYLVKKNIISNKMSKKEVGANSPQVKTIITFFNEGVQINKEELLTCFNEMDVTKVTPSGNYDLVIISDVCEDNRENIIIFSKIPETSYSKYELSNIQFLALYLKYNDNNHIINLCESNKNYYVVGNIINNVFVKYYLINVLKVTIDDDKPFVYTLELMDHNVSMVYLDETQSIIIQKDGYKIEDNTKVCQRQGDNEDKTVVEDNTEVIEDKTEVVEDKTEVDEEESSIFKDVEIVEKEKLE
jgi:hypothetical protein